MKFKYLSLLLPFIITACGGGGGGSSSTPPPQNNTPEPQDTLAPSVSFNPDTLSIDSEDVADSELRATDNVGVTSGPNVECTNGGSFNNNQFTAPATTELIESVCTAEARDAAGNIGTAELTVTIAPPRSGISYGKLQPAVDLRIGNFNIGGEWETRGSSMFGVRPAASGTGNNVEIVGLGGGGSYPFDYGKDDIVTFEGEFTSADFLQTPSMSTTGLGTDGFSVLSEEDDKIYYYYTNHPSGPDHYTYRQEISVEDPCDIADTQTWLNKGIYVGQRDKGISIFRLERETGVYDNFTTTLEYTIGDGRSLCTIWRGALPREIYERSRFIGRGGEFASPLMALDHNTNELVFYGDLDGDKKLDEIDAIPLDTQASKVLEVVDAKTRGSASQVPRYMLVLLTDGEHLGEHRVMQVTLDRFTGSLEQWTYAWDEGVPIAMGQGFFGGSLELGIYRPDLFVVLGTAENSMFFDNLRLPSDDFTAAPPLYGDPELFTVGIGATSAVAVRDPNSPTLEGPDYGVAISFKDNGDIRYVKIPDWFH